MPECSTPSKRQFRSEAEAKRYWRRTYFGGAKDRLWPYQCGDHFHLTHQTPAEQEQVAAKIAALQARTLQVECPRGCGNPIEVLGPKPRRLPHTDEPEPYPTRAERRMFESAGRSLCESLLIHALFECAAFAAEDVDCGHRQGEHACNLSAGHQGRHEHHAPHPGEPPEADDHLVAWWPNLQAVRDA